jgi:Leucine-rich repeat (LRR) protein
MANIRPTRPVAVEANDAAEKIIVAAFKVLLPGAVTRVEGVTELVDVIFRHQDNKRNRKSLLHRLEESVDLLAEKLAEFEKIETPYVGPADKKLAIEGVCTALASIDLNSTVVIKEQLDPERISRLAHPEALRQWQKLLISEGAKQYGEHYLALASQYIVALVRQLPEFTDELLVQILGRTDKIYELIQRGIANVVLPMYRHGVPDEVSMFDAHYLSDILQTYKDMELFGLTGLPPELCRQPIDVAYITLQTSLFDENGHFDTSGIPSNYGDSAPELRRVDAAFSDILAANAELDSRTRRFPYSGKGTRTLLTGQAGSGKTTVAHWLAIRAAEHRFPESLHAWNDCMPFIVPLRHVFHGSKRCYPREEDLILASSQRAAERPGNWINMRLSGHALVIFDGLDELSDLHKSDFRSWLMKLEMEHPLAHFIVTSRPDGLDNSWFSENNFTRLDLHPMQPIDVNRCIDAWFNAVVTVDRFREVNYRKKQKRLAADLSQSTAVRELAETPLLCAMLCAFYAHNLSAMAPQTRGELYERVINSLAHTRETERSSELVSLNDLSLRTKLSLLQALARHLTERSQTTIYCWPTRNEGLPIQNSDMTAREVLVERLRGMTPIAASVDELLRYLLDRSVLFRRITANEAQFAHRSLQEYIAACDYADSGMVEELCERSGQRDWWSIIVFAAGKMKMPLASRLVSMLLDRAQERGDDSRDLLLLAAQCYGSAGRLVPDVAERTKELLTAILPPRTLEEAELVSYAGEDILPWLGNHPERAIEIAVCCMRAAALIGGPSGMATLRTYVNAGPLETPLQSELIHNWQHFEAAEYAQSILADVNLTSFPITLDSKAIFRAAHFVTSLRRVRVAIGEPLKSVRPWGDLPYLEEVDWPNHHTATSLDGVGALNGLRKLNFSDAAELHDIRDLGQLESLRELYLTNCRKIEDISAIGQLEELRVLVLDNCTSITDFSALARLRNLRTLSVNGCRIRDLRFCENLTNLRRLIARTKSGLSDLTALETCTGLRVLDLGLAMRIPRGLRISAEAELEQLTLSGAVSAFDVESIEGTESLRSLSIDAVGWLESLSPISHLQNLKHLSITNCGELRHVQDIEHATRLEYINLSGSDITDTEFARHMLQLKQAHLARCRSLTDLSGLIGLPLLEYVDLTAGSFIANADELRRSSASGQRLVIVEDPYVHRKFSQSGAIGPTS